MFQINQHLLDYYKGIKPNVGYIYYFLAENLKNVPRDQLKIGIGFYRSDWIDGSFLFESDSYLLKSLKEFLAGLYLKAGGFAVWSEWTMYHSRLWAAVGISRLMGYGSFYLTGQGPMMILRKELDEIPSVMPTRGPNGKEIDPSDTGYLVYRDPGGGAHLRNWKVFYVVLSEILGKAGLENVEEEILQAISENDPETRFVIKADEEIFGFPSAYKVEQLDQNSAIKRIQQTNAAHLNDWLGTEAQFDAGGFTEEFKAYYKFMVDHYGREDELPDPLSLLEHGISWFLSCLSEELRPAYKTRYYDLVHRFARSETDSKMILAWLDEITNIKVTN
ncbi:MAG TPA: hypothetical protein VGB30_11535 [bacterium]|jgi:hypothetical protein